MRVASLIPSGTEIVSALGMADTLVGRSHCCDYPAEVRELPVLSRPRVDPTARGGEIDQDMRKLMSSGESAYDLLVEPLLEAAPDVVITQDHCDACAVSLGDVRAAAACAGLVGARLCALHPHDLDAVRADFRRVAQALDVPERGETLDRRFAERLRCIAVEASEWRPRVVLLEWLDPPMVAGGWIPQLARVAGLEPLIVSDARTFRRVSWSDVAAAEPDALVVMPCGFSATRTLKELAEGEAADRLERLSPALTSGCWIVDGDALFNRPGPRLAESAELLAALFHPAASRPLSEFAGMYACLADR